MKEVAAILFAAVFTFAASLSAGLLLLKFLKIKLLRMEMLYIGFVLGAASLSSIVLALTVAGLAYTGVFLAAGLILIGCAFRLNAWPHADGSLPLPLAWNLLFLSLYGIFAALYIGNALLPETSPDGLMYHVALIARYFREHRLPRITTNFYASFPEGLEMLFLFGFAFGRHSAAAMVHLLFLLMLPLGMLAYARRFGAPAAGVVGGLLFFLSPVAGYDGTIGYNDVGLACVLFACFYVLQIWREQRSPALIFAAGLLAGFGYAVKYNGGLAIVYVLAMVVFCCRRKFLRPAMLAAAAAFLMMGPWIVKNIVVVHNPFMPFATRYFPNPYLYPTTEMENTHAVGYPPGIRRRDLPLQATVHGSMEGMVGPVFLLAPLMLLALRRPAGRQLSLAALIFFLPYFSDVSTRFLLPCLPFIALAMAWTIAPWRIVAILLVLVHAVASWPAVLQRYAGPYCWCMPKPDWSAAFRRTAKDAYLRDHVADYEIGLLLNQRVPPSERVLATCSLQSAYHQRQMIDPWNNAFGTRMSATLSAAFDNSVKPTWRHDFHFPEKTVRGIRVVQTARAEADNWSIAEVRVLRAGVELPRTPRWRLQAWPNPWEVQSAFDNNPVTRWTTGQPFAAGMYLAVDFGAPEAIDQVLVECGHNQVDTRMRLVSDDGQVLAPEAGMYDEPPVPHLRRAAIETLKSNGIRWLVTNDRDHGAQDFRDRTAQWGITPAGSVGQYRLYRLD